MQTLYSLIEEILQQNGFSCSRKDTYILAEKADAEAVVCPQISFDSEGFERFLQEFEDFRGRKILAVMDRLSEEDVCEIDSEIIIWDKESLEREITRSKMDSAINEESISIVDEIESTDFPPLVSPDMPEDASVGEFIMKVNVSEKEIEKEYPQSASRTLHLVPYHAFCYSIRSAEAELNQDKKIISVNSITGNTEEWQELDFVYSLEIPHIKVRLDIDAEKAEKIAIEKIAASNSRTKEYIVEDSQTTLTERRKISPKKEEIVIEYCHLCHVPIWHIINGNDEICINAHDRKISDIHKSNTIAQ